MSPSPEAQKGHVNITGPFMTAQLNLYDDRLRLVTQGIGQLNLDLPPGLYRVETTLLDGWQQKYLQVEAGQNTNLYQWEEQALPDTAAPYGETWNRSHHESQMGPAQSISNQITDPTQQGDSRLFIFIRTVSREKIPLQVPLVGLALLRWGSPPSPVTDFLEHIRASLSDGFLAYTANLPSGPYVLAYLSPDGPAEWRCHPVWLCAEFESQVFIPWKDGLQLQDLSMSMVHKGQGFNFSDEQGMAVETVLRGIYLGKNLASSDQMHDLLRYKFENPWLGILAAYAMLIDPATPDRELFDIVLWNLENRIGLPADFPDLAALHLTPDSSARRSFDFPPMINAGLRKAGQLDALFPETLAAGSLSEFVINRMLGDTPWTAWYSPGDQLGLAAQEAAIKGPGGISFDIGFGEEGEPSPPEVDPEILAWLETKATQPDGQAWVKALDLAALSQTFGIPRRQIDKIQSCLQGGMVPPAEDMTPAIQAACTYLYDQERYASLRSKRR